MAKTLSANRRVYVLKFERQEPEEAQTKFHIRPLKFRERNHIQDAMVVTEISMGGPKDLKSKSGLMKILSGTQNQLAIENGLLEIENLQGPGDDEVLSYKKEFESEAKQVILDSLQPEWVREIAEEILIISGMSEREEKN